MPLVAQDLPRGVKVSRLVVSSSAKHRMETNSAIFRGRARYPRRQYLRLAPELRAFPPLYQVSHTFVKPVIRWSESKRVEADPAVCAAVIEALNGTLEVAKMVTVVELSSERFDKAFLPEDIVDPSKSCEYGAIAACDLPAGAVLGVYVGEVLPSSEHNVCVVRTRELQYQRQLTGLESNVRFRRYLDAAGAAVSSRANAATVQ